MTSLILFSKQPKHVNFLLSQLIQFLPRGLLHFRSQKMNCYTKNKMFNRKLGGFCFSTNLPEQKNYLCMHVWYVYEYYEWLF